MTLGVSSWFVEAARRPTAAPRRYFRVAGRNYGDYVVRWPTVRLRSDTINLGTISLTLSNRDRAFQFFVESAHALTTSCEVGLGFAHPEDGVEQVSLYLGQPSAVAFDRGGTEVRLQLQGKTRALTDIALGSDTDSGGLDFTGSAYFPADLAWTLVTCHGLLSAEASSANPDLDYESWANWRALDEVRDVRVKGFFNGQKIYEALNTLAAMDATVVLFRNGKLDFAPLIQPFGASGAELTPAEVVDVSMAIDPTNIVNEISVEADYDLATQRFGSQTTRVHSASLVTYGKRSGRFGSRAIWFASAADGAYMAEDRLRLGRDPTLRAKVTTPLAGGLHLTVGDVLTITDSVFQQPHTPFRIAQVALDLAEGAITFDLEAARQRPWNYLATVSSLNMQVPTIARLGTGDVLAIEESVDTTRVFRSDSAGIFQPLDLYATAWLPFGENGALFGGPPDSGSGQAVIQRSTDGGSSAVTVSSLSAGLQFVHHFLEVVSGTFLASTNSGGIWRSTDAGSSWSLTQVITPGYHVRRFLNASSGRVWGGTGYDFAGLTDGMVIWESTDDGATWTPKHTVLGSGDFLTQGMLRISDTDFLVATSGLSVLELNTLRSDYLSADSIGWTTVLCAASFSSAVRTTSEHLLFGFHQPVTLLGGGTYRSEDGGYNWIEDALISKQGNVQLVDNGDGTIEAYSARIAAGARTDRYRNYAPNLAG